MHMSVCLSDACNASHSQSSLTGTQPASHTTGSKRGKTKEVTHLPDGTRVSITRIRVVISWDVVRFSMEF